MYPRSPRRLLKLRCLWYSAVSDIRSEYADALSHLLSAQASFSIGHIRIDDFHKQIYSFTWEFVVTLTCVACTFLTFDWHTLTKI